MEASMVRGCGSCLERGKLRSPPPHRLKACRGRSVRLSPSHLLWAVAIGISSFPLSLDALLSPLRGGGQEGGQYIDVPAFRNGAHIAVQAAATLRAQNNQKSWGVSGGKQAQRLADLALESRLNCSLRLDLSPDFVSLGGRQPGGLGRQPCFDDSHIFCRSSSLGNSLALMRRFKSEELDHLHKAAADKGGAVAAQGWSLGAGIQRVRSFGNILDIGTHLMHNPIGWTHDCNSERALEANASASAAAAVD
eukprot:CAMPEP_0181291782 /NCGR_PEP_ID=MMETSP1101-20121128/2154_1 /TAXON_ID=46948 /ORGANISM="Rhodomonas abbreviata, Strain Caron Lab Isolate" /LENGTH=249 /DNA_ID=CAMNT_0023396203 /DNA_START=611 /DNA_END=1357 /DNA_ORIENTATION=+